MEYGTTHTAIQWNGEESARFLHEFEEGSLLRGAPKGQCVITYDVARHPFAEQITRLLVKKGIVSSQDVEAVPTLDKLHSHLPTRLKDLDASELNEVSKKFYDTDEAFLACYETFLKEIVEPQVVGGDFLFQKTPTIRFHFPNQNGFNWRPRFHTDIMLGHPPQEINIWLPVAGATETASMLIASMQDSIDTLKASNLDFPKFAAAVQFDDAVGARCASITRPVEMKYGQALAFDARCLHATQFNTSPWTRISIDFRVIPISDYERMGLTYRGTGRRQMLFKKGHYYSDQSSSQLRARGAAV